MKKSLLTFLLIIFVLMYKNHILFAQNPYFDVRIEQSLQDLKLRYEKNIVSGDYKFYFQIKDRTQQVFVQSVTTTYNNLEFREVYSTIYRNKVAPSETVMRTLMIESSNKHLGAWELFYEAEEYYIVFNAKISANLTSNELQSVINLVAVCADDMEKQIFADDTF